MIFFQLVFFPVHFLYISLCHSSDCCVVMFMCFMDFLPELKWLIDWLINDTRSRFRMGDYTFQSLHGNIKGLSLLPCGAPASVLLPYLFMPRVAQSQRYIFFTKLSNIIALCSPWCKSTQKQYWSRRTGKQPKPFIALWCFEMERRIIHSETVIFCFRPTRYAVLSYKRHLAKPKLLLLLLLLVLYYTVFHKKNNPVLNCP